MTTGYFFHSYCTTNAPARTLAPVNLRPEKVHSVYRKRPIHDERVSAAEDGVGFFFGIAGRVHVFLPRIRSKRPCP